MEQIIIIVLIAVIIGCLVIIIQQKREMHRMMDRLTDMVQEAIEGTFSERVYDETKMSALESRIHRFLQKSAHSEEKLSAERDKVKKLIADIAHQTKTPIANLMLYGQLLEEQNHSQDSGMIIEQINLQAEKMKFLIDSLMKSSRLENGIISVQPKENPVLELVDAVVNEVAQKAERKAIELEVDCGEMQACFDPKWTEEAVYNIVDNAVKYSPEGGKVRIIGTEYEQFCRIDIEDEGKGIAEEEIGFIFNRFYRSASVSAEEGVGIGLFLAREIINIQNGYIKVSSESKEGSVFSVFIPKNRISAIV